MCFSGVAFQRGRGEGAAARATVAVNATAAAAATTGRKNCLGIVKNLVVITFI
jgi:hypothetical protein